MDFQIMYEKQNETFPVSAFPSTDYVCRFLCSFQSFLEWAIFIITFYVLQNSHLQGIIKKTQDFLRNPCGPLRKNNYQSFRNSKLWNIEFFHDISARSEQGIGKTFHPNR